MRAFINYVNDIGELWELVEEVTRFPTVQGVLVEPHPVWRLYWNRYRQMGLNGLNDTVPFRGELLTGVIPWWSEGLASPVLDFPDYPFDLLPSSEVGNWLNDQFKLRWKAPLLVRVIVRPALPQERAVRSELIRIITNRPLIVILEERPRAELAVASGDGIHAAMLGTVGGFLQHSASGAIYGVTCAHVALSGNVADASGSSIGNVSHTTVPTSAAAGTLCNRANSVNTLDATLFSLTSSPVSGSFSAMTTSFGTGQGCTMRGQKSGGPHNYEIGALAVIQNLNHAGSSFCFKDLFEVRPLPTLPISIRHSMAFAHIPLRGDSGAFIGVHNASGGRDWCGMLVGTDHVCGYAVEADAVLGWAAGLQPGNWNLF